jgi:hypothetical protein
VKLIGTSKKELRLRALEKFAKKLFVARLPIERALLAAELRDDSAEETKQRSLLVTAIKRDNKIIDQAETQFKQHGTVPQAVIDALVASLGKVPTLRPRPRERFIGPLASEGREKELYVYLSLFSSLLPSSPLCLFLPSV